VIIYADNAITDPDGVMTDPDSVISESVKIFVHITIASTNLFKPKNIFTGLIINI
jgi:hypothetical protein